MSASELQRSRFCASFTSASAGVVPASEPRRCTRPDAGHARGECMVSSATVRRDHSTCWRRSAARRRAVLAAPEGACFEGAHPARDALNLRHQDCCRRSSARLRFARSPGLRHERSDARALRPDAAQVAGERVPSATGAMGSGRRSVVLAERPGPRGVRDVELNGLQVVVDNRTGVVAIEDWERGTFATVAPSLQALIQGL